MRAALALFAVTATAAILAAGATALSEPAYLTAAQKICTARAGKMAKLPRLRAGEATAAQLRTRLQKLLAIYTPGTRKLRALKPPGSFSFLVPRWLHYENLRIDLWRKGLKAARLGQVGNARSYIGASNVRALRAAEIADGLGLERCE
jgi:hypothetical protein